MQLMQMRSNWYT